MEIINKILVVGGDPLKREDLCKKLEAIYHEASIKMAPNGEVGFELFKREKPDVVLSGVRMPEMNGRELLENIRKIAPIAPVVMICGLCSQYTVQELKKRGAVVLVEPFDLCQLIDAITEAMMIAESR